MIDRDKVVQDAFNALSEQGILPTLPMDRKAAAHIVYDVMEPVIREDERQRILEMPGDDPSYGWHFEYMQDQLVFAEKVAALLVRVIGELDERNALLLDALENVVDQACQILRDGFSRERP